MISTLDRSTTGTISVSRLDPPSERWDRFVEQAPAGTFGHLASWIQIVDEVFGHECIPLVALDDEGTWRGLLPLVRVKSRLLGHHLVSMPFLSYGGPIGEPEAEVRLAHAAATEARRSGADLLELRCRHGVDAELRRTDRKITVLLELPSSAEELWRDGLSSKVRNIIRRPLRLGLETRFGRDQVEPFYEVFARHMRDLGTPVMPRTWFDRIAERFRDRVVFAAVYSRSTPVAGGCGFVWRDEFEITWASALRTHKRESPNMLLYWSLMEEMIRRGLRGFNFGRCSPGGGTHAFKRQWGGLDAPLPWLQWSRDARTAPPSPEGPLFRVATAIWQRLPLALTNQLGPHLVSRIP